MGPVQELLVLLAAEPSLQSLCSFRGFCVLDRVSLYKLNESQTYSLPTSTFLSAGLTDIYRRTWPKSPGVYKLSNDSVVIEWSSKSWLWTLWDPHVYLVLAISSLSNIYH